MKMKKFLVLFGLGVGFVLGSRAGREPYERLRTMVRDLADRREFQQLASTVSDRADAVSQETVGKVTDIAGGALDRISDATDRVGDKVADKVGVKTSSAKASPSTTSNDTATQDKARAANA
jgi:hypothetical protein